MTTDDPLTDAGAAQPRGRYRLFFALVPDEATRARLHQAAMQLQARHAPGGRWINPQRYHLTLQFLGDFDGPSTGIATLARHAAARVKVASFTLVLDRAGSFNNRAIPWWLGPGTDAPGLSSLWHGLGTELAQLGVRLPDARGFRPHVTVLRDARAGLPATAIEPVTWRVESFHLLRSAPGASNAYSVLGTWPLMG